MITSHQHKPTRQNYDYNRRSWRDLLAGSASARSLRAIKAATDSVAAKTKGPSLPAGAFARTSVPAPPVGAGPDQGEAFLLIVEAVGVDWRVHGRTIHFEAHIAADLLATLCTGGAAHGAADQDAVAGAAHRCS